MVECLDCHQHFPSFQEYAKHECPKGKVPDSAKVFAKVIETPEVCQNCGAKDPYRPLLSLDPKLDDFRKCRKCGHEILLQPEPSCEFYRSTPEENRCMEGDCYYGNTEETRAFGNCCFFCPKKTTCEARCSFIDEETQGDQ